MGGVGGGRVRGVGALGGGREPRDDRAAVLRDEREEAEGVRAGGRSHWGIENEAHWVLDVVFKEEQCKAQARTAAENLGVFRRWVHNLLLQRRRAGKTKETAPMQRVELLLEDAPRREVLGNLVAQEV